MDDALQGMIAGAQSGNQMGANAAQWAFQAADVGMKRQYLQQAQEQHEQQKFLFNAKLGDMQLDDVHQAARMDEGPAKKSFIGARQDYWEKAGHPVADSLWASTSDPAYKIKWDQIGNFVKSGDPQSLQRGMQSFLNTSGSDKEWMPFLEKTLSAFAVGNKAQGFADPKLQSQATQAGMEFNNNTTMKLLDAQKSQLSHVRNLLEQANSGQRARDLNLYHEINNTLVSAATQSGGNSALGKQERTEWVPFESTVTNTLNKLTDKDFASASSVGWKKLEQTFEAIDSAATDFQKDKAIRIARGHLGTISGNPYMEGTLSSSLGSYGLTMDDVRNYKPKPPAKVTGATPPPGDKIRADQVQKAKDLYQQIQSGVMNGVKLSEGGKKAAQNRYETTYSKPIRDEAEKAGNQ